SASVKPLVVNTPVPTMLATTRRTALRRPICRRLEGSLLKVTHQPRPNCSSSSPARSTQMTTSTLSRLAPPGSLVSGHWHKPHRQDAAALDLVAVLAQKI